MWGDRERASLQPSGRDLCRHESLHRDSKTDSIVVYATRPPRGGGTILPPCAADCACTAAYSLFHVASHLDHSLVKAKLPACPLGFSIWTQCSL